MLSNLIISYFPFIDMKMYSGLMVCKFEMYALNLLYQGIQWEEGRW